MSLEFTVKRTEDDIYAFLDRLDEMFPDSNVPQKIVVRVGDLTVRTETPGDLMIPLFRIAGNLFAERIHLPRRFDLTEFE